MKQVTATTSFLTKSERIAALLHLEIGLVLEFGNRFGVFAEPPKDFPAFLGIDAGKGYLAMGDGPV